jgi:hypothetical protein
MDVTIQRVEAANHVIVKVSDTHAVISVKLAVCIPLRHMALARTVNPFAPVAARLYLGTLEPSDQCFYGCRLEDIKWTPPPKRARTLWF